MNFDLKLKNLTFYLFFLLVMNFFILGSYYEYRSNMKSENLKETKNIMKSFFKKVNKEEIIGDSKTFAIKFIKRNIFGKVSSVSKSINIEEKGFCNFTGSECSYFIPFEYKGGKFVFSGTSVFNNTGFKKIDFIYIVGFLFINLVLVLYFLFVNKMILGFIKSLNENEGRIRYYSDIAYKDQLTGAYNRHYYKKVFPEILRQACNKKIFFLMIDLDKFKSINDKYGHEVGDNVLKDNARFLKSILRKSDYPLIRMGGEEFLMILFEPEGEKKINIFIEELYEKLKNFKISKQSVLFNMSIGITQLTIQDNSTTVLKRADEALYFSKENGRGQASWLKSE